jgi:hypothetical protein
MKAFETAHSGAGGAIKVMISCTKSGWNSRNSSHEWHNLAAGCNSKTVVMQAMLQLVLLSPTRSCVVACWAPALSHQLLSLLSMLSNLVIIGQWRSWMSECSSLLPLKGNLVCYDGLYVINKRWIKKEHYFPFIFSVMKKDRYSFFFHSLTA